MQHEPEETAHSVSLGDRVLPCDTPPIDFHLLCGNFAQDNQQLNGSVTELELEATIQLQQGKCDKSHLHLWFVTATQKPRLIFKMCNNQAGYMAVLLYPEAEETLYREVFSTHLRTATYILHLNV
jgi:hypothetical protein